MPDLDPFYAHLLSVGFIVMRQAAESADRDWLDAEFEMLHNVPSLIGEANAERHGYFWNQERTYYIEWVSTPGREKAKSRMLTYYQPIWDEMAPVVARLLGHGCPPESLLVRSGLQGAEGCADAPAIR